MSPKFSSLAFDEVKEEQIDTLETKLNLLVKSAARNSVLQSHATECEKVAVIEGRITVSF